MLKKIVAAFVRLLLKIRYRVDIVGLEQLKDKRGALILPNHPAEIDPVILSAFLWKFLSVRPLILEKYYYLPVAHGILRWIGAIAMPDLEVDGGAYKRKRVQNALNTVVAVVAAGDNVLFYPAGRLMISNRERLGGNSGAHYVMQNLSQGLFFLVRIRGLYGSSFSKLLTGGHSPDFFRTLLSSSWIVLKNLVFFVPKRTVRIEIEPAPADMPIEADAIKLNRWLEEWYNQPEPEQPSLVSYSVWSKQIPEMSEQQANLATDFVAAPELVETILAKLAEESGLSKEEISLDMRLNEDLGLDSLGASELMIWMDDHFETSDLELTDLLTVGAVIKAAAGIKTVDQIEPEEPAPALWREDVWKRQNSSLPQANTIGAAFLEQVCKAKDQVVMADARSGVLKARRVKLAVLLLAEKIKAFPGTYVGVMLPASVGAALALLAVLLARKVPVLLNWTTGRRNLEHSVKSCDLKAIITSKAFLDRVDSDLEGVEELFVFMEDLKFEISFLDKLRGFFQSRYSSFRLIRKFGLDQVKPEDPAVVLFTSGSEAAPKGVPLSHRNILSNISASVEALPFDKEDIIYSFLPPFHSFGLTATTLLPILSGCRVVFYPNPNESRKIAAGCQRWGATCMVGTPTFLKGILASAPKSFFVSLRLLVTGAERAPEQLFETVSKVNDQAELIEGYGITECSPVVCANRPGKPRLGVGYPVRDVKLLIVDLETKQPLAEGERGLILISGPNVFNGYLGGKPDPFIEVAGHRWYNSGDLGYIKDGALVISGRLKRFVKIGGEMISLPALEDALKQSWPDGEDGPALAVIASEVEQDKRPDLILFSVPDISLVEANQKLKEAGFTNIVKISDVRKVKSLPLLGSGKADLQTLKQML